VVRVEGEDRAQRCERPFGVVELSQQPCALPIERDDFFGRAGHRKPLGNEREQARGVSAVQHEVK
jgi:hypothetical protein